MTASFLKTSRPGFFLVYPVIIAAAFIGFYTGWKPLPDANSLSPLLALTGWTKPEFFISFLISMAAILGVAILSASFSEKYFLGILGNAGAGILVLLLGVTFLWQTGSLGHEWVAALILFPAYNSMFAAYRSEYAIKSTFNAAFITGVASLIYLPAITSLLLVWFALFILKPFRMREFFVSILGAVIPWLLFHGTAVVFSADEKVITFFQNIGFDADRPLLIRNISLFALAGLLTVIASFHLGTSSFLKKISMRRYFGVLFLVFISVYIGMALLPVTGKSLFPVLLVPMSYICSMFLASIRSRFLLLILFLLIITLLVTLQFPVPWLDRTL